eukprot:1633468-Rhodomonas_salina.1
MGADPITRPTRPASTSPTAWQDQHDGDSCGPLVARPGPLARFKPCSGGAFSVTPRFGFDCFLLRPAPDA